MISALRWLFALTLGLLPALGAQPPLRPPNVVIIFADDLGYGDLGCYGGRKIRTPNLDRLAAGGMRFTSFYAAQAVCSASRAALLTGCFPNRIGIQGALGPNSRTGLHPDEWTLAEVLKTRGYATAIFGKWHLGDAPEFLPPRHGFDEYFGLPYSNDMWPFHPDYVDLPPDVAQRKRGYPDLPLIQGDQVVIRPVTGAHQARLTTWYTEHAVRFIERHRNQPFFLYVPHSMPHVPLFVSDKFKGKSRAGLYGDVIEELDWSVGQIVRTLKRLRLEQQTLVMFTSDNGPWLLYGNHAGSAGPWREGKGTMFEGGVRVPFIARWPGHIPQGRECSEIAATVDLLPTVARLAGADLPPRKIDGRDLGPLLRGEPGARTPHEAYPFFYDRSLHAMRSGPWKLHFARSFPKPTPPGGDGRPGKYAAVPIGQELFNLDSDPGETRDVAATNPDVVQRLLALAEVARADLGDAATRREGTGVRPAGRLADPSR